MKKILIVVQQQTSNPGLVGRVIRENGYQLDIRYPCLGQDLPTSMDDHSGAIIFGGPMSANDDQTIPFIRTELDWIPVVLDSGKPFFGICLGAQLLARVLGSTVAPHPENIIEFGYFSINPADTTTHFNTPRYVYHCHREGFELPIGTELLASGTNFVNQAYRYGKTAYGVQFHPEITKKMIELWTTNAVELYPFVGAQSPEEQISKHSQYGEDAKKWLQEFIPFWLNSGSDR